MLPQRAQAAVFDRFAQVSQRGFGPSAPWQGRRRPQIEQVAIGARQHARQQRSPASVGASRVWRPHRAQGSKFAGSRWSHALHSAPPSAVRLTTGFARPQRVHCWVRVTLQQRLQQRSLSRRNRIGARCSQNGQVGGATPTAPADSSASASSTSWCEPSAALVASRFGLSARSAVTTRC
jgi:hypothetical protein